MALTPKQEAFCNEYIKDFNGTQAAIRAGYKPSVARKIASDNLKKPAISERIAEVMRSRSERTKVDADWLLMRLAAEAEADIADLYFESGALKPVHQWPEIWRKGLVSGIKVEQKYEFVDGEKIPDGVVAEIKLSDRVKRLELIGKHIDVSAFVENLNHQNLQPPTIVINRPNGD